MTLLTIIGKNKYDYEKDGARKVGASVTYLSGAGQEGFNCININLDHSVVDHAFPVVPALYDVELGEKQLRVGTIKVFHSASFIGKVDLDFPKQYLASQSQSKIDNHAKNLAQSNPSLAKELAKV